MVKVISFDLDDTLSDSNFYRFIWFTAIPEIYAKEKKVTFAQAYYTVIKEYYALKGIKEWTDPAFWLKHFKLKTSWTKLLQRTKHEIRHFPETRKVLGLLKKKYVLIIMTAAPHRMMRAKLAMEGIATYFYKTYSAPTDFGSSRKTTEVYRALLKKLKISPDEILHVGDHPEYDYVVPKSIGMRAVMIDRTGKNRGAIKNLKELLDFI
jgi:5'-nucleotidase